MVIKKTCLEHKWGTITCRVIKGKEDQIIKYLLVKVTKFKVRIILRKGFYLLIIINKFFIINKKIDKYNHIKHKYTHLGMWTKTNLW